MKSSWWWVASLAAPALGKLNLVQRDLPAVVEMSTQRNPSVNPVARDQRRRMRRDNTVSVTLDNEVRLQFVFFFLKKKSPVFFDSDRDFDSDAYLFANSLVSVGSSDIGNTILCQYQLGHAQTRPAHGSRHRQ